MKLSVITVCYNAAEPLRKTISSVERNKDFIYEYIVVDGGSTDNTSQILDAYSKSIDVKIIERDQGISDAFNKGINLAAGSHILLLNAGDILIHQKLDEIKNLFDSSIDVILPLHTVDSDGSKMVFQSNPSNLHAYCSVFHPGAIVKSDAYKSVGLYNNDLKFAMDYDWFCRAFFVHGLSWQLLRVPLVSFSTGGISSEVSHRSLLERFSIRKKYFGASFPVSELTNVTVRLGSKILLTFGLSCVQKRLRAVWLRRRYGG